MMDKMKPYSEYKDTGLPWAPYIPKHWDIKRIKHLFLCIDIRSKTGAEERLTVSSKHGVIPRSSMKVTMFEAESYIGHKLCWPGDLVINSLWAWSRGLGVAKHHGLVSSAYGVYRLKSDLENYASFIHHFLRSKAYHWELRTRSKGVWISRLQLTDDAFLRAPILLPPEDETRSITRFILDIDRKVNAFIRNRRRLIEVLNEQKQAIINQAVIRGIDPEAPLKPSGIDWLGDIPAHWEIQKLRFIADSQGGMTPSKAEETFWNGSIRWVTPKDMKRAEIDDSIDHITNTALKHTNIKLIDPPVVLIVVRGMILARTVPVAVTTRPVTINQDMKALMLRPNVDVTYMRNLLVGMTNVIRPLIEESGHGTRVLRTDLWRNMLLPLPPFDEQELINSTIARDTANVEVVISRAQAEISLVHEYRTRLVSDVVTGKIDVRHLAPPRGNEDLEDMAEALDLLEDDIVDDVMDDEEDINESD